MKKIAIVGAEGFIGGYLSSYLEETLDKNEFKILRTAYQKTKGYISLDVTSKQQVEQFLVDTTPNKVILLAGTKDVKKCEEDFSFALKLNSEPTRLFVKSIEANRLNTSIIFLSSDYVFEGTKGFYLDSDPCFPKTNYGKSKLIAEDYLKNSKCNYNIVRTSAIMAKGANFLDWLVSNISKNKEIEAFSNIFFSPTPISILNEGILRLVLKDRNRVTLNLCGGVKLSRYEFSSIVKKFFPDSSATIEETLADTQNSYFCSDLSMINSKEFEDLSQGFTLKLKSEVDKYATSKDK